MDVRALLLSAGFGTRLRPLTTHTPKCLVEINNEPILESWLKKLEALECEGVIVNTHYLSEQVKDFLESRKKNPICIKEFHEKELLGTAGTLLSNADFFKGAIGLVIHADNATTDDLTGLLNAHKNRPCNCLITMLTFSSDNPTSCGIVQTDNKGTVTQFYEKISNPPGNTANGAVYAFDYSLIEFVKQNAPHAKDLSTEVLPLLIGRIYTYHTQHMFIDIGTPENLAKARKEFSSKSGKIMP